MTKELKPGEKCPRCGQIAPNTDHTVPTVLTLIFILIAIGSAYGLHLIP